MRQEATPSRTFDSFAERVSRLLEPSDREALCGDLQEYGVTGFDALHDVLSLVVRRQIAALRNVRPWLEVTLLTVPVGLFLSVVSRQTADGSAIYLWLYASNLNPDLVRISGYWRGIAECLPIVFWPCLKLTCASWTAGLLIGLCARQIRWLSVVGLIAVMLYVETLGLPHSFGSIFMLSRARDYFGNAAVFTSAFYRVLFPAIILLLFSVLPFICGLRRRLAIGSLPPSARLVAFLALGVSLGALVCQSSSSWILHLWDQWPIHLAGLPSPITMLSLGSAAYLYLIAKKSPTVICRIAQHGFKRQT